jgi:hypothetical protein
MRRVVAAVAREVGEAIVPTVYFIVVFHAVAITKATFLADYGLSPRSSAVAVIGALLVAKAILVTDKRRFTNALSAGPLLYSVMWKAAIFTVFTTLFRVVEELIHLTATYGSLRVAVQHIHEEGLFWHHFWLFQMWVYGSIVMYCFVSEQGHRHGAKNFKDILLARAPMAR